MQITRKNGLSSNYVYRLVKDKYGSIWVATDGDGVTIFKDTRFQIFDSNSEYGANEAYGVLKAKKGALWFANSKGLTSFKNEVFKTFSFPEKYKNVEIWDIEELSNGKLALLTYENSLLTFNGERFSEYNFEIDKKPFYNTDVLVEKDGRLLLSGEGGVIFINGRNVDTLETIGDGYWDKYVNLVYKDSKGIYWFGTEDGIIEYKDGKQTRYNKDDGVEGSSVYEIKEDGLGNLWFGTNKGITTFTKRNNKDNPYSIRTFETAKNYLTETMFIQFDDRVVKFNFSGETERLELEKAPQLFFNSISINGNEIITINSEPQAIELDYDENNIEIDFGVLNYKDPNRVLFKHRLNGFDKDFLSDGDDNTRLYTNLKPGEYEFEVYAKSPNSDWSDEPLTFEFLIKKPYWLQLWFIFVSVIAVGIALYLIVKFRVASLEKKKLKVLVDEQTKELKGALEEKEVLIKEIHHRVKNNLAVISGLLEMQSWSLESEEARKALNESKLRVLAIAKIHENLYQNKDLGKIDFENFLNELKNGIVAAMQVDGKNIELDLIVDSGLIRLDQAIPCGLIINELLTNSFKHAFNSMNEGRIVIKFTENEDYLFLSVSDNGIGIDEKLMESKKSSLGITLIESLVVQLNAELKIKSDNGATFELTIPIKD